MKSEAQYYEPLVVDEVWIRQDGKLIKLEPDFLREISELSGLTGSNREPLISMFRLQHLNKEKGECLIFSGRKNPYFAHLPDIEEYDGNNFTVRPLPLRQIPDIPEEAYTNAYYFQKLVERDQNDNSDELTESIDLDSSVARKVPVKNDQQIPQTNFSMDDIIAKIDKRIAELEAEEAEKNKAENETASEASQENT